MKRQRSFAGKRTAFTLVELMVSMALTMFIMVILSQAFVTSLDTFDGLKGIGDLEANLRTATTSFRYDLRQDHFEAKRRLGDANLFSDPVREGFFYIRQGAASLNEGTDSLDNLPSFRATNHVLYFTSKLRGNRRENYFSAPLPSGSPLLANTSYFSQDTDALFQEGNTLNSQWAEIAYFLIATDTIAASGTPLHALYRSQYLMLPNNKPANDSRVPTSSIAQYANVSCTDSGGNLRFNSPIDVLNANNRTLDASATPPTKRSDGRSPPPGSALLLTNVVSFNIRVLKYTVATGAIGADFADLGTGSNVTFDTGASPASTYTIKALQINLRIWDTKTQQTRQVTIVQDM